MIKTKKELIKIHKEWHKILDRMIADYILCTEKRLSNTTLMEFMEWSHKQTINPKCYDKQ